MMSGSKYQPILTIDGTVVIGIDEKTKEIEGVNSCGEDRINDLITAPKVESPGKLPNIVTLDNIKETRYARNPRISRVLNDFGWVRELNEGVKRIYTDMEKFFLDDPIFSEPEQSVKLVLKNNIIMRNMRRNDRAVEYVGEKIWKQLDQLDHDILAVLASNKAVSKSSLAKHTNKSMPTMGIHLRKMIEMGVVRANGNLHDPGRTYSIVLK